MKRIRTILCLAVLLCLAVGCGGAAPSGSSPDQWDGSRDTSWYDPAAEQYTLTTAEQLAGLSALVAKEEADFAGKTVTLAADLDLCGLEWIPIGSADTAWFQGVFDGGGHTIYNLQVTNTSTYQSCSAGLFGWTHPKQWVVIRNLTVDGAQITGHNWTGVVVGYMTGDLENCTVRNAVVLNTLANEDANGDKAGGVVGALTDGTLRGCTVTDSVVEANRDAGGLAGSVERVCTVADNAVQDVTVIYHTEKDYPSGGPVISGRNDYPLDETNTAVNVSVLYQPAES